MIGGPGRDTARAALLHNLHSQLMGAVVLVLLQKELSTKADLDAALAQMRTAYNSYRDVRDDRVQR